MVVQRPKRCHYVYIEMVVKVTIPYDPVWKPLDWAKKHCASYISNDVDPSRHDIESNGMLKRVVKINYFFSDEKDALMFLLRWSDE